MRIFAKLLPYLRPYWHWLALGSLLAVVVSGLDGAIAYLVKPAMDEIFLKHDLAKLQWIPLAFLAAYLVKGAARYGQSYLMAAVGERVITAVRRDLYAHIQRMPLAFFHGLHSAELMSRLVVDTNRLAKFASQTLVMTFRQVATIVALLIVMVVQEWRLTLLALIAFPLVALTIRALGRRLYRINRRTQEKIAELNTLLQEAFTGTKIVKAFGREAHERARFDRVNQRLLDLSLKDHRLDELTEPLMEVLGALGIMAALWYGGYRVIQGDMTPGTFFSFIAAVIMLYGPVRKLSRLANTVQQTTGSAERVFEILALRPTIEDAPGARVLPAFREAIEFDDVWFQYEPDGEMILKEISLTVRKGEVVAFVGMSGAGKSTLIDLLPRFHDATRGRILVDGVDVREYTQASLRAQIGLVTQETFLFGDTVYANIAYGKPDATEAEVYDAARRAYAHDFIVTLPEGYLTPVGERGVRLSGGQRQRIAIARAFLKDPAILILDEATSELDAESEFMVQQAMANLMQGRTVFLIAHRLSTIRHADRIVVFHEGRIIEEGRHDELLSREGLYRRLYALQYQEQLPPATP